MHPIRLEFSPRFEFMIASHWCEFQLSSFIFNCVCGSQSCRSCSLAMAHDRFESSTMTINIDTVIKRDITLYDVNLNGLPSVRITSEKLADVVTISDRKMSECRWNYTLFDSSYHQSHRLHIKHMRKYPSIRENEGE